MSSGDLYDMIDFSDRETLKQLLYKRAFFERSGYMSRGSAYDRNEINSNMYTDLIAIYMDLDDLIKRTNLTDRNLKLIELVMEGNTISYIYENIDGYSEYGTIKMFSRVLEKIAKTNENKR